MSYLSPEFFSFFEEVFVQSRQKIYEVTNVENYPRYDEVLCRALKFHRSRK